MQPIGDTFQACIVVVFIHNSCWTIPFHCHCCHHHHSKYSHRRPEDPQSATYSSLPLTFPPFPSVNLPLYNLKSPSQGHSLLPTSPHSCLKRFYSLYLGYEPFGLIDAIVNVSLEVVYLAF